MSHELVEAVKVLENRLAIAKKELNEARLRCGQRGHPWGEVKYIPDHQDSYTIPGDPVGTMGVDWRGPTYVPAKTTRKWSRTCAKCELTQVTTTTKPMPSQGATPGTVAIVEQPDFGDGR